jgi:hypothetical protein
MFVNGVLVDGSDRFARSFRTVLVDFGFQDQWNGAELLDDRDNRPDDQAGSYRRKDNGTED